MHFNKKKHRLGFWQLDPMPTIGMLEKYYSETYFQNCESNSYSSEYSAEERTYFNNIASVSDYIWKNFSLKQTGNILDVGCGEGFFCNYFYHHGWTVEGCDFSSFGIKRHNPELLSCITQGNLFQILDQKIRTKSKYDFINLSNVLEHVLDPVSLLDGLKNIMHSKSLLRICVPNDFSKFQQLLLDKGCLTKETWFVAPDHINYFTFSSLETVLENGEYNIVKMLAGFPIEIFLINQHSNYWADRQKGKQAHMSRVRIENFLIQEGVENYLSYMSGAARCEFGREIIAFVSI